MHNHHFWSEKINKLTSHQKYRNKAEEIIEMKCEITYQDWVNRWMNFLLYTKKNNFFSSLSLNRMHRSFSFIFNVVVFCLFSKWLWQKFEKEKERNETKRYYLWSSLLLLNICWKNSEIATVEFKPIIQCDRYWYEIETWNKLIHYLNKSGPKSHHTIECDGEQAHAWHE